MQLAVAPGEQHPVARGGSGDGRRAADLVGDRMLPEQRSIRERQARERRVLRADEHAGAIGRLEDRRSARDLSLRLVRPAKITGRGVEGPYEATIVANHHEPGAAGRADRRRRREPRVLGRERPAVGAVGERHGPKRTVEIAEVDHAVGDDGHRAKCRAVELAMPRLDERQCKRSCRPSGSPEAAPGHRPGVGGGDVGIIRERDGRENDGEQGGADGGHRAAS